MLLFQAAKSIEPTVNRIYPSCAHYELDARSLQGEATKPAGQEYSEVIVEHLEYPFGDVLHMLELYRAKLYPHHYQSLLFSL